MWVKVWTNNSDPRVPAKWFVTHLFETKVIPRYFRLDRGTTETTEMTAIHAYIHHLSQNISLDEASDTVIFGTSTANQIERWWKELHEKLENFYKPILERLLREMRYLPTNDTDR